jgi:hypothetical protein
LFVGKASPLRAASMRTCGVLVAIRLGNRNRFCRSAPNLATARLSVLEALLPTLATKADISDVKAEIAKVHSDFGKWIVATVITLAFGILAAIGSIVTLLRPMQLPTSPQASQPSPIVIYNTPAQATQPQQPAKAP